MNTESMAEAIRLLLRDLVENQYIESESAAKALESLESEGPYAALEDIRSCLPQTGDSIRDWTR